METNLALYNFICNEYRKLIPLVGIKPNHDLTVKRTYIKNGGLDKVNYKYSKDIEYYLTYDKILSEFVVFKHDAFECRFTLGNVFRLKKEMELLLPKKHHQNIF